MPDSNVAYISLARDVLSDISRMLEKPTTMPTEQIMVKESLAAVKRQHVTTANPVSTTASASDAGDVIMLTPINIHSDTRADLLSDSPPVDAELNLYGMFNLDTPRLVCLSSADLADTELDELDDVAASRRALKIILPNDAYPDSVVSASVYYISEVRRLWCLPNNYARAQKCLNGVPVEVSLQGSRVFWEFAQELLRYTSLNSLLGHSISMSDIVLHLKDCGKFLDPFDKRRAEDTVVSFLAWLSLYPEAAHDFNSVLTHARHIEMADQLGLLQATIGANPLLPHVIPGQIITLRYLRYSFIGSLCHLQIIWTNVPTEHLKLERGRNKKETSFLYLYQHPSVSYY